MNNAKSIRKVLEDSGFEIYSVRKKKRMEGGVRYTFRRRLRDMTPCRGIPYWYYQIELRSKPGLTVDDYELAALILREAGYEDAGYSPYRGLRFDLPMKAQIEHRIRLKY